MPKWCARPHRLLSRPGSAGIQCEQWAGRPHRTPGTGALERPLTSIWKGRFGLRPPLTCSLGWDTRVIGGLGARPRAAGMQLG